jgi:hypothetical protein
LEADVFYQSGGYFQACTHAQGQAGTVLRGSGSWLSEKKVAAWSIEANTEAEAVGLHKVMSSAGYLLRYCDPTTRALLIERPEHRKLTNLIFVRAVAKAEAFARRQSAGYFWQNDLC